MQGRWTNRKSGGRLPFDDSKRINRTGRRGLRGVRERGQDTPFAKSPRQQSRPITCAPAAMSSAGGVYASNPRHLRAWSPWPWRPPSSEPPSCGLISYLWSLPVSPLSGPASAPGEWAAELARPVGPGAGQLLRLAVPDPSPFHPPSLSIRLSCTHRMSAARGRPGWCPCESRSAWSELVDRGDLAIRRPGCDGEVHLALVPEVEPGWVPGSPVGDAAHVDAAGEGSGSDESGHGLAFSARPFASYRGRCREAAFGALTRRSCNRSPCWVALETGSRHQPK